MIVWCKKNKSMKSSIHHDETCEDVSESAKTHRNPKAVS